jgi:SWI/SNF-related matrix-associated actin-dependent regulator 1 of chromatin subfamily A
LIVGHSNLDHYKDELLGLKGYVFDESHAFKNFQAKRTRAAIKLAKRADVVLCLTGTPITNRPAEFAPQLQVLGRLEDFGGKVGYWRYYCAGFKDQWGRWNVSGARHLDELNDKLRSSCMVRRRKEDVLEDLPPVLHNRIILDVPLKEYKKAEADIIKYVVERAKELAEEMGVSPRAAAVRAKMAAQSQEQLVRISVLRRLAAIAKMDSVIQTINELREEGRKVVVAAHHRDIVQGVADAFDGLKIQGGMKTEEVEAHKKKFQEDPDAGVISISMEAAKMGHTLTAASDVIFVELPWTPADVDQTYSRCHRIGQKGTVTAHYLLAANTIDEVIYDIIESKRDVVNAATDGGESFGDVSMTKALLSNFLDIAGQ